MAGAEAERPQDAAGMLYELSRLVNENAADVPAILDGALRLIASRMPMLRGAITLISPRSGEISIEASYGLNEEERSRGHYLRGEGVTGRVIQTGEPMLIADVSREPLFLNRTGARDLSGGGASFLCVPIRLHNQVAGALSVDREQADQRCLEAEGRLLSVIAAILAPAASEGQQLMDPEDAAGLRAGGLIGGSQPMRLVQEQIALVAPSSSTVLLLGESGTGKELAARAIHAASARAGAPFVSINCAALPESLIESELFGHERGAFTGANSARKGRFELADGGTLFLDEVGELSLPTQAKLLRVLQERSFERLGAMQSRHVDLRIITATNRDLERMVAEGAFRKDLFYRLNVFPILLPPLRERQEDILPICAHFLRKFGQQAGHAHARLSLAAMEALENYAWPGNIREAQNAMERASLLLGHDGVLETRHLPQAIQDSGRKAQARQKRGAQNGAQPGASLPEKLAALERDCIARALEASRGHMGRAAGILGLTERVLGLRMKKYGISYRAFRPGTPGPGAGKRP